MMKLNSKTSELKLGRREKRQQSPRSPLKVKDLNASSSYSSFSSNSTIEAPSGCLRFFLSHHSSSVSKNACNNPKFLTVNKTPKSAPNVKKSKGKLGYDGNVVKTRNDLQNPEKPNSRRVLRVKKNPSHCLYPCQSGRKPSSRSGISDRMREFPSGSEIKLSDNAENFTPITKLGCGSGLDSFNREDRALKLREKNPNFTDTGSPIPPIEASLSPELQGGSTSMVSATPTPCYGAGHVLSGVSDKRKCRPRGTLIIGDNDLFGSSKTKVFNNEDDNVNWDLNNPRVSLVPSPTEASMQWVLSPCDEKMSEGREDDDRNGLKSNQCEISVPLKSIGLSSSRCSSLGFSSELFNKSISTITSSDATTVTNSSRKSRTSSEFRGFLGPSFDHFVCSPTPSSPTSTPTCNVAVSTPTTFRENSTGSGNVIRTPQSNSSSSNFGLSHLSKDEISRLWFECELDSVTEVLQSVSLSPECRIPLVDSPRTSFEFNPLIKPTSSNDFTLFREAISHNLPESEVRISWREGLASRLFEMDEIDCCRCLSDEEEDVNGCAIDSSKIASDTCSPTRLVQPEENINIKDEENIHSEGPNPCVESITNNGVSTHSPKDSGWTLCYKNNLFQI